MIKKTRESLSQLFRIGRESFFAAQKGRLSWYLIFRLAVKNLVFARSRSIVTMSAIAIGTAAIVLLVSFGYGLQEIVTKRLVQPNSLRLADVLSSSTALTLNTKTLKEIAAVSGVEKLASAVSLAGSLTYNESKVDVVILGVDNLFLEFSHLEPLAGAVFSEGAEAKLFGEVPDLSELAELELLSQGVVAGAASQKPVVKLAEEISGESVRYRIADLKYLPLRESPALEAKIIGYVRGSIMQFYDGREVWGSEYQSVTTVGRQIQARNNKWYGRWLKTRVPVYEELAPTVYQPLKNAAGEFEWREGYLIELELNILNAQELAYERQLAKILKDQTSQQVLGEATESGEVAAAETLVEYSNASAAASSTQELRQMVRSSQENLEATRGAQLAVIKVKKKGGKELLVTTALLNIWKIAPEKALGTEVDLEYIISGGQIPKVAGRIVSKSQKYQIVGVIKNDKQPLIYAPLADLQSMGISRYSLAKVLAASPESLKRVRERIESIGFTTQSIVDTLLQVERLFRVMRFLLGAFGMIALVVAVFGMFNTLTVSLLERTREVGVMKTLGTTDSDVVRLFLVESLIIGFVGGVMGLVFGAEMGALINTFSSFFRDDKSINLFKTPPAFMFFILLVSVAIGLATGLYPSRRARKISALNALRYE